MPEDDDPARSFLDQTLPNDDAWAGREPPDSPARPRHVQQPDNVAASTRRRGGGPANAALALGLAGSALYATQDEPDQTEPEPPDFGEIGGAL